MSEQVQSSADDYEPIPLGKYVPRHGGSVGTITFRHDGTRTYDIVVRRGFRVVLTEDALRRALAESE